MLLLFLGLLGMLHRSLFSFKVGLFPVFVRKLYFGRAVRMEEEARLRRAEANFTIHVTAFHCLVL
jgi:hypothetical protein